MKKRLLALGLAGMMMLGALAGCGGGGDASKPADSGSTAQTDNGGDTASSDKQLKIGLSMAVRDQFLTSMELAAKAKAEEIGNIQFEAVDANNDMSLQISHVQTWAADGYDAAIVCLVNNDSAQEIINAANGMNVVFVNRQPDLSLLKDNVVYVGTDESLYGKAQGEYLTEYFKKEGKTEINAVLFQGVLGLDNVIKRTQSVKDALEAGGIKVNYVYEDTAEWDRAKAMDKFVQFMGSGKPFDVVISNNDEMALGVIEAMKTSGEKKVLCPVVGIDATDVGCQAVKDGDMLCTVFQDPAAQGGGTIECAVGLATGKPIENLKDNYYNIIPQLVTIDNVDDFLK
ncbi:substrate-binding domain-containing protein [Intestinibacillus massiliensis]|uniref:substrate-binding domain-containing protein n=1 Tax=Intestinibacillus massiliensis TaxID=1871029 RepID=UPI00135634F3|nr:substrate-binding domain-containing protein [Intestinibacillus massiliensis]MCB6365787.1 substrate-binding domain-containing protein [Intestinibacillus massiliensis]